MSFWLSVRLVEVLCVIVAFCVRELVIVRDEDLLLDIEGLEVGDTLSDWLGLLLSDSELLTERV